MQNNFRIRTEIGKDKIVNFQLDQNIEFLEILSFKIRQSDVYTLDCANYGVVVGRVTANNGFGIPNARVSIFIPLSDDDSDNELITSIYPYKTITEKNEDGYRYNLLPYKPSYPGHVATGTFPTIDDVMFDGQAIEVYEKYYKYTVKTNSSGDYMMFGVPIGSYSILMDLDLSDMGEYSLTPQDLIRMGMATEGQFDNNQYQQSTDLSSLPQIVSISKGINISPLWGDSETCDSSINRSDFDLRDDVNIDIQPTAIFIGSIFSTASNKRIRSNCKPKDDFGNLCGLETGPGSILAIRQTLNKDEKGLPILETYRVGNVIDSDGSWVVELPMNLEYVITNENGDKIITNDPSIGIPTKGKYRFKIKWEQSTKISEQTKRAYFLVPNIKEYGWNNLGTIDPMNSNNDNKNQLAGSYYFGLDWSGYTNSDAAIRCEDTFYEFKSNKVYTVSSLIDQYRGGSSKGNFIGIKEIADTSCDATINKYPVNDGVRNFDFLFFLFSILFLLFSTPGRVLLIVFHFVKFLWNLFAVPLTYAIAVALPILSAFLFVQAATSFPAVGLILGFATLGGIVVAATVRFFKAFKEVKNFKFQKLNLPMITYPDCELCDCGDNDMELSDSGIPTGGLIAQLANPMLYRDAVTSRVETIIKSKTTFGVNLKEELLIDLDNIVSLSTEAYIGQTYDINKPYRFRALFSNIYLMPSTRTQVAAVAVGLPPAERINKFNSRENYFKGNTRIDVTFASKNNKEQHSDNVLVIVASENRESGTLLTFLNFDKSKDINFISGYTATTKISAETNNSEVVVKYANPSNPKSLLEKKYMLPYGVDINKYLFPADIEFYQVVTGMTVSEFKSKSNQNSTLADGSFNWQCLRPRSTELIFDFAEGKNPNLSRWQDEIFSEISKNDGIINYFNDIDNQYVLILQRGVDPYSPLYENTYNLGKIFGFANTNQISIKTNTRLNIPIQPLETYSVQQTNVSNEIMFDSYFLRPINSSIGFGANQAYPFRTNANGYYSGNLIGEASKPKGFTFSNSFSGNLQGLQVNDSNLLKRVTTFKIDSRSIRSTNGYDLSDNLSNMSTYYLGLDMVANNKRSNFIKRLLRGEEPYNNTYTTQASFGDNNYFSELFVNNKTIFRTDRLPTSDYLDGSSWSSSTVNTYYINNGQAAALQQNLGFATYEIVGSEQFADNPIPASDTGYSPQDFSGFTMTENLLTTLNTCNNMVSLGCYTGRGTSFQVDSKCAENDPVTNGCYSFVDRAILDIPKDLRTYNEWVNRFRYFYALCRGVVSEVFVNNWVNGSLFAFPIQTKIKYNNKNQAIIDDESYCNDLIYFDAKTTNFYYRSSPFSKSNSTFVGRTMNKENVKNLMFPTTIMDLGYKNSLYGYNSDNFEYYSFVLDKIEPTSYGDNSDILNLFAISRITNGNFIRNLKNINDLFSREYKKTDGDYSQLLSINSEFGVDKFSSEFYTMTNSADSEISIQYDKKDNPVIGIFYSSSQDDLQLKDYLTPGRVNFRALNNELKPKYFGIKSQIVPFYQWELKGGNGGDLFFGNQDNSWYTSTIITDNYQNLDRIKPDLASLKNRLNPYNKERYFYNNENVLTYNNDRGYLYNDKNQATKYGNKKNRFLVGAPFYFYFGIKKGASALDKFKTKYLNE
jgi:hypothetical protein